MMEIEIMGAGEMVSEVASLVLDFKP